MITKCYHCTKVITTNSKKTIGGTIYTERTNLGPVDSSAKKVYFCSQRCKDYMYTEGNSR